MSNATSRPEQPAILTPDAARDTGEVGQMPTRGCPSWCELPPGHPYLDVDSADSYRIHRVSFGADVSIYQEETIYGLGRAWINADVSIDEGSSVEGEQLARQLRAAALRLRAIQAGAAR